MKFAKLEQNIILALFLATFEDFALCDVQGNDVAEPPPIDLEGYSSWKPKQQIRLKYRPRKTSSSWSGTLHSDSKI